MKTFKGSILGLSILLAGLVNAQETAQPLSMKNMIKIGVNAGIPVPSGNTSAVVGLDAAYQNLVTPSFGLGIASGYSQYFGRDVNGIDNNDFGVVPVAAMLRYYPKSMGVYIGTDIGYGFIVGNEKVAANSLVDRPDGCFYLKPEIGYHNRNWNFSVHYQNTFTGDKGQIGTQKYNAGSLGVGVGYNIPLGN